MRLTRILIIIIIFASFAIGVYFYPQVPDKLASHWNIKGEVDSYMPKFWGLFLMPVIVTVMFALFIFMPKIDPFKANYEKFRNYYEWFMFAMSLFLFYIYMLTIIWNFGVKFDMGKAIIPAIGFLFYLIGIVMENAKRNWFIGIRTPWTLSSEIVWDKTHKIGGLLFKISGAIALIGLLFPDYSMLFVLIPVMAFSLYTIVYSYFEYQKEVK